MASGTTTTRSRYFNGEITTANAAAAFSSAAPVPVSPFWDDIDYSSARKYLDNFSQYELPQLPIGPNSADKPTAKLQLLLRLLQEKLTKDEAEAATSPPNFLHGANCTRWYDPWQAIYTIQNAAGLLGAAGVTIRMLVVRQPQDTTDVRPQHLLAEHLVAVGQYAEAEEAARPVCAWMDAQPRLEKGSPQAISARRVLARALWGQGLSRQVEAEALLAEIDEVVDGTGVTGGRFAVYQEEEKRLNVRMRTELRE